MSSLTLENAWLKVTVNPEVGGTITGVLHKPTGLSVLGNVPWEPVDAPLAGGAARDEPEWLTRYGGGWPLLFPNAGDSCTVDGVFHGFHGEASITPWTAEMAGDTLILTRRFEWVPATMQRRITLTGETLSIHEDLAFAGRQPMEVMWGHHPTFGSDLLDSAVEITCGASRIQAEAEYDPPFSPIARGAEGQWPRIAAKAGGTVDLAHPQQRWAAVAYLSDFQPAWAAIRRLDNAIAIRLRWDGEQFPCAWLWYELEATAEAPWGGKTRLIGIEPNTTPCAMGLAAASRRAAPLLHLEPGGTFGTTIELDVFTPSGPVTWGREGLATQTRSERV